jgi:uncharacterized protein YjbI with pentapeptide repeats
MSPPVIAAIIAVGGVVLTVIATVIVQISGRRATSRDTQQALEEQRKQLDRTLAEQRTRTLNERFATAAEQLGSDKPAIRLAGMYSMAGLADDWPENQQTCVDVLCAYLRMPYEPDPGYEAPGPQRLAFQAIREIRHTVIRVITAHLRAGAAVSWEGLDFDFTGVVFDGGDFSGARFSGGTVDFSDARFSGGIIGFTAAQFSGAAVYFSDARFSSGQIYFDAVFSRGMVSFGGARFSGGDISFHAAQFSGGAISFGGARFSGGTVDFSIAQLSGGTVNFTGAQLSGAELDFSSARFSGGAVSFGFARFSGGRMDFTGAQFSGGKVSFGFTEFSGAEVDFSHPADWSHPPEFHWTGGPPPGVKLPKTKDQPSA